MASSSATSIQRRFKYDMFVSFRGEDTRKTFVDHLYSALQQKGIETYKDDERIKKGKRISDDLMKSIEDSKFYIIVFSKNYASSSWCLDELVKIMECHNTTEHAAYPVFYDVEPSEVRKQSGAVGEAFAKYEEEEAAEKWRRALKEAADLAGWELKNIANGHEATFIHKIVGDIFVNLHSIYSSINENLVGMENRIMNVLSSLEIGCDDVRMIGIKGMGGAGKTTLARAVFDQISFRFEGKSFVENVREVSTTSLIGLTTLQERLLRNVSNDQSISVSSVGDGKNMIRRMMSSRKVLIVLDDVDNIEQLRALAGEPNWFKLGSRIIITTRDEQVLLAHHIGENLIRNVDLLLREEAICLFSRYAFRREVPLEGYEKLSEQVVRYAAGLPLTIKVLGSSLCGNDDQSEWRDVIERLKTIPFKKTQEKLEVSYNSLEDDYKEIFLDVACILKGLHKDQAISILESCGFHAKSGLKVLTQKSLITISDDGNLGMHDHIEEMGKNIVRRSHPDPRQHSRLWIEEEIEDILAMNKGTQATRCIRFYMRRCNANLLMRGFEKMENLRYLKVHCFFQDGRVQLFDDDGRYFANSLRYLDFFNYPFRSLPKTFQVDNLVTLEMSGRYIVQLWEGGEKKVLRKLKVLSLISPTMRTLDVGLTPNLETLKISSGSGHIKEYCLKRIHLLVECPKLKSFELYKSKLRTLDLRLTLNLKKLIIDGCDALVKIHMPIECLMLNSVKLISLKKLKSLDIGPTPNLEKLELCFCYDFQELRMPIACQKLKYLDLSHSKLKTFDVGMTPNLEELYLRECRGLKELHVSRACQKLKYLDLSHSKFKTFDVGMTPNLKKLHLQECHDLEELYMPTLCLNLKFLDLSGSKLRTLDLGLTPYLEWLDLKKCYNMVELHAPIGCLENLVHADLSGCSRFKSFLFDKRLIYLEIGYPLPLFAVFFDECPLHSYDNLPKFGFTSGDKEHPASSFGNLEELISMGVSASTNLESLSESIHGLRCLRSLRLKGNIQEAPMVLLDLECLQKLTLTSTKVKHLPDNICRLKNLKDLELTSCRLLQKLPEDLGLLECLEVLVVVNCILLQDIPNSICGMKLLKFFSLHGCILVEKLPDELGSLECLEVLNIERTGISQLPQSIHLLKGLAIYGSRCVLQSCSFTAETHSSVYPSRTYCKIQGELADRAGPRPGKPDRLLRAHSSRWP